MSIRNLPREQLQFAIRQLKTGVDRISDRISEQHSNYTNAEGAFGNWFGELNRPPEETERIQQLATQRQNYSNQLQQQIEELFLAPLRDGLAANDETIKANAGQLRRYVRELADFIDEQPDEIYGKDFARTVRGMTNSIDAGLEKISPEEKKMRR